MSFIRDLYIILYLVVGSLLLSHIAEHPEDLGHWLQQIDTARYDNAGIEVN